VSTQGYIFDALSRHQLFIQRLASGQVKKSLPIIRRMAREIRAALLNHDLTSFQAARLTALQLEINAITKSAGVALEQQTMPAMQDFAAYEAQFTQKMLAGAVTVELAGVNSAALSRAIESAPMKLISGKKTISTTMLGIFDTFAAGTSREVMTAVQAGITRGSVTKEIAAEVFGLVNTRTKAQAETVVRTAANMAGSVARNELYKANADVFKGEEYSAVLDGSTTITCASLDGNIYPIGVGPLPPLHYNCRSVRVPVVDDAFKALREGSTRASMTGPVSSQTTYNSWLGRQSKEFQVEVLGAERAELFRSGKLTLSKFTDDAGRVYTLDELKAREGLAL
jgi:SPP1 gp7 family putative phage head morphogenesis protein